MRILILLFASACIADPAEPVPAVPIAKQSTNSLDENAIADYAIPLNQLVNAPFADGKVMQMLSAAPRGLELLDYSARCTFAPGTSIQIPSYLGPVTVPSPPGPGVSPSLGLAADWLKRGLAPEEQEWLMGCLLAHINAVGPVDISLRGPHPALATTKPEVADFTSLEGAFYGRFGDPFDPDEGGLTIQRACYGPALAKCGAPATILYHRLCTIPGGCPHLQVVGPCEAPKPTPAACQPRSGDWFGECYSAVFSGPPAGERYTHVITSYLRDFKCPM